jgi:hypothetical protein
MNKILYFFIWIVLISAMGLMLLFGFWLSYPYKVIEFKSTKTVEQTYKTGTILTLNISHCKYMPLPAKVVGQFVDGIVFTLKETKANAGIGCATRIAKDIIIPKELEAGTYLYRQTMIYRVNPVRTITVVFETNKFDIVQ